MKHEKIIEVMEMVHAYLSSAAWMATNGGEDPNASRETRDCDDATWHEMLTGAMGKSGEITLTRDELHELFDFDDIVEATHDCLAFCGVFTTGLMDSTLLAWTELRKMDPGQAGHDLYLSRNGHGTGFFDRGLGAAGDTLQKAARDMGETNHVIMYRGQDYYA